MIWVRILGAPVRNFYRDARTLPHLPVGEARHEWLLLLGSVRSACEGEAPKITITLRNGNGECARAFAAPPLAAVAEVRDETGVLYAGTVRQIALADDHCRIEVEA